MIDFLRKIFYKKRYIYIITTFYFNGESLEHPRTIGVLPSFRKAEKIIKYNIMDICECNYYNLAVIEKVQQCMYPEMYGTEKVWYSFKERKKENLGYKYFEYSYKKLEKAPFSIKSQNTSYFYRD